jgi:hypothetical protein
MKINACFGNTKQLKTRWCKVDAIFILGLGHHLITFNKDQMVSICRHMWVLYHTNKNTISKSQGRPYKWKTKESTNYAFNLKVFKQIKIMNGRFSLIILS